MNGFFQEQGVQKETLLISYVTGVAVLICLGVAISACPAPVEYAPADRTFPSHSIDCEEVIDVERGRSSEYCRERVFERLKTVLEAEEKLHWPEENTEEESSRLYLVAERLPDTERGFWVFKTRWEREARPVLHINQMADYVRYHVDVTCFETVKGTDDWSEIASCPSEAENIEAAVVELVKRGISDER